MAAILTNGVLKIPHRAHLSAAVGAGALQGLWEHKGSRCTPANAAHSPPRRSPAPARVSPRSGQTAKLTLSQLINRLLPQRAPVWHERLRRPAFRGRPRRHLTTSPPQLRHTPVTAEITPAAPRSISPHPLRSRSIFRVTLGLRNGGPRYGRCIVTPRYTPMPQTHQRQVRPTSLTSVQHFQHLQKNRREKLHAGGPGPVGGNSRPSALAVLRLMTRSYLIGCCTGRSEGFSPLRMRST